MNIEVDVYKALEALLLQECSGDAIVDDDDDEKTFASKNVSVSRVRLAMKLSEEKTTLRNTCVVVVKYGRSFESKVYLDRLGFMVSDDESVFIPVPSNDDDDDDDDGDALVFEVWSDENLLVGIGKTTRLQKETVVKIRNPLSKKDTTVAILAIVVV
jgi:hypothetical protein